MKLLSILALCAFGCASAYGANKCTGADGKVTYQDGPCQGAAKATTVEVQPTQQELAQQWRFTRERDAMTNEVMCFAISPSSYLGTGYRQTATVNLQFAANPTTGGTLLTVRSSPGDTSGIFHNNVNGVGVKVDNYAFTPLTQKLNQHALGFEQNAPSELFSQLENAKELRLRLRFWPYDELRDASPISMRGAKQALLAAMKCGTQP